MRSGFISVIGKTNVGKSSLINSLLSNKVAIISSKPQTTRKVSMGIYTDNESQMIFMDTPGMFSPKYKLDSLMLRSIRRSLKDIDLVLLVVDDRNAKGSLLPFPFLKKMNAPIFLIINKIDRIDTENLTNLIDMNKQYGFKDIIPVSALTKRNLNLLISHIKKYLPIGPMYFSSDTITTTTDKEKISETIREKFLICLRDEVPHGVAVNVESINFRKTSNGVLIEDIDVIAYCEKESHKGIIIGNKGNVLKQIGIKSRKELENMFGIKINLHIWLKLKKNWRNNDFYLQQFGYINKK